MTNTITTAVRYLAGPALALGLALSGPAVANAERIWDIGEFDSCTKMHIPPNTNDIDEIMAAAQEHDQYCCWKSGGDWTGEKCAAPPAESQGNPTRPGPYVPGTAGVDDDPMAGTPKPNVPMAPGTGVG
jgi:hypothetical protein